jgi:hypothetical protein
MRPPSFLVNNAGDGVSTATVSWPTSTRPLTLTKARMVARTAPEDTDNLPEHRRADSCRLCFVCMRLRPHSGACIRLRQFTLGVRLIKRRLKRPTPIATPVGRSTSLVMYNAPSTYSAPGYGGQPQGAQPVRPSPHGISRCGWDRTKYFQPAVNIFNPLAHLGANNAAQQAMMQAGMQYAPRTGDRRSTRVETRLWRGSSVSSVAEHLHAPLLQAPRVIGMPTRPSAPPTKMYPRLTHATPSATNQCG